MLLCVVDVVKVTQQRLAEVDSSNTKDPGHLSLRLT